MRNRRLGTGTRDIIRRCREAGLPGPEFMVKDGFVITVRKAEAAARSVPRLESRLESRLAARVLVQSGALGKAELAAQLGHKTVSGELHKQIRRLLEEGWIEMTLPEKPNSRLQRYRLSVQGTTRLVETAKGGTTP